MFTNPVTQSKVFVMIFLYPRGEKLMELLDESTVRIPSNTIHLLLRINVKSGIFSVNSPPHTQLARKF